MGLPINDQSTGDERLKFCQDHGKFKSIEKGYNELSGAAQYEIDQEYGELKRVAGTAPILGKTEAAPVAPVPTDPEKLDPEVYGPGVDEEPPSHGEDK